MVAGVYALIRGNADGWGSSTILAAFAACAVLFAAFLVVEARRRQPWQALGSGAVSSTATIPEEGRP